MSSGGGMGMASFFTDLGDKLHKNINQSIGVIGGVVQRRKEREQREKELEFRRKLDERRFNIERMLAMQGYREKEGQMDWMRQFRNAMARGSYAQPL